MIECQQSSLLVPCLAILEVFPLLRGQLAACAVSLVLHGISRLRLDVPAVFRYTFRRRGGTAGIDVLCGRFSGLERFRLFAHDLPSNLVTQRR